MFYFFALLSVVGYALQQALLTRYARRMDGLSLGFYRNASFIVTLLPLLFFVSHGEIVAVLWSWRLLVVSGLCGGLYLAILYTALKFLPLGITSTFNRAGNAILLVPVGWLLFGEVLSVQTLAIILFIVVSAAWLGLQKNHMPHLDNRVFIGIVLACTASCLLVINRIILTILSRDVNPLAAGYFWEVTIAFGASAILIGRKIMIGKGLEKIPLRQFGGIALCAAPTLLGTMGFALAVERGPVGIVGAISAGAIVLMTLLAHWLYKEKLSKKQWVAMLLVMIGVGGLGFV